RQRNGRILLAPPGPAEASRDEHARRGAHAGAAAREPDAPREVARAAEQTVRAAIELDARRHPELRAADVGAERLRDALAEQFQRRRHRDFDPAPPAVEDGNLHAEEARADACEWPGRIGAAADMWNARGKMHAVGETDGDVHDRRIDLGNAGSRP